MNISSLNLKNIARNYHQAVSSYDKKAVQKMISENYIQHNPFVPTGRSAFIDFLSHLKKYNSKIINLCMIQDGNFVAMHHIWKNAEAFGAATMESFHIIRFNRFGIIVEHWNVMSEASRPLCIKQKITDQKKTLENKLSTLKRIKSYIHSGSNQDNLVYDQQHAVFGEGNFVLSVSEGHFNGIHSALYDLFKYKNGTIIKCWNIYQPIPKTNLANPNTMFNF